MGSLDHSSSSEPSRTGLMRTALAGLPRIHLADPTREFAGIMCRHVVRAGLSPSEVRAWTVGVGGYEGQIYVREPTASSSTGPCRPAANPESYFAIPIAALQP